MERIRLGRIDTNLSRFEAELIQWNWLKRRVIGTVKVSNRYTVPEYNVVVEDKVLGFGRRNHLVDAGSPKRAAKEILKKYNKPLWQRK